MAEREGKEICRTWISGSQGSLQKEARKTSMPPAASSTSSSSAGANSANSSRSAWQA